MGLNTASFEARKEAFFAEATRVHNEKFDYSKVEYVNAKTPVIIICPTHGEFQQEPYKHTHTTYGCQSCWDEKHTQILKARVRTWQTKDYIGVEEYLQRINLSTKYSIDVSNYTGLSVGTVTITCPNHGSRTVVPKVLLVNQHPCLGCAIESSKNHKLKGYDQFLVAARELHGDKYEYPFPEEYVNRKSVLTVRCEDHGDFLKKAQKHLSGQGCNRCRIDELIRSGQLPGGYDDRLFAEHPEIGAEPGTLYYLRVGRNYKIGITRNRLERRLASIRSESKQEVTVLGTVETTLQQAYVWEQKILQRFDEVRVIRRWSTELFSEDILGRDVVLKNFVESL